MRRPPYDTGSLGILRSPAGESLHRRPHSMNIDGKVPRHSYFIAIAHCHLLNISAHSQINSKKKYYSSLLVVVRLVDAAFNVMLCLIEVKVVF